MGRPKPLTLAGDEDPADLVRVHHQAGSLTLVVVNQVRRAQAVATQLDGLPCLLLHSRFRRAERRAIEAQLKNFQGVVVATQAVEAGIDLDARLLITDLCPWSSFVQRCGRVGRNNTYADAAVIVVEQSQVLPYSAAELAETRQRLEGLGDACVRNLMAVPSPPQPGESHRLTANTLQMLFDSHPLEQGDIDFTPYLRVGEMRDVSVLWRQQPGPEMATTTTTMRGNGF